MILVVDRNIPFADLLFGAFGTMRLLGSTGITHETVRDADVLIVRSETKVDAQLLEGSSVRFVGTATIGTDHLDMAWLSARGITIASAPGCNANSVKEYVLAALLTLSARHHFLLRGTSLGVVGVGNVGGKVAAMAEQLGMNVLCNDPPRKRSSGDARFLPLDALMNADIITLHVPLTRDGDDPTVHLFDASRINKMKPGALLINTSRGAVVETEGLKSTLAAGHLRAAVLDVWENEPAIDVELLRHVALGTPHIAGYSLDGKVQGGRMIREQLARFVGTGAPPEPVLHLPLSGTGESNGVHGVPDVVLREMVRHKYDIEADDLHMRQLLKIPAAERPQYFRNLRAGYRVRREFFSHPVQSRDTTTATLLRAAGFLVQ